MAQEEEVLGKAYDSRLMRRLLTYLRPYRWQVTIAIVSIIFKSFCDVLGPYLVKVAVDRYLAPVKAAASGLWSWLSPRPCMASRRFPRSISACWFSASCSNFCKTYFMQWTGQKIMFDLRSQIFRHLQRMHVAFYDKNPVGRLVTRVTTDVDALNEMFTSGVVSIFEDLFVLVGILGIMLCMNWKLALITFAVLPFIVVATKIFRDKVRDSYRRIRTAIARINSYLQEHVSGMVVLQLFNRERKAYQRFSEINRSHMDAYKDAILAYSLYYPVVDFFSAVAIACVIWFGGQDVMRGIVASSISIEFSRQTLISFHVVATAASLGVLIAFTQYAQRFFRPIMDFSEKYNILQSAMAASERIFKLLDTPVDIVSPAVTKKPKAAAGSSSTTSGSHIAICRRRAVMPPAGERFIVRARRADGRTAHGGDGRPQPYPRLGPPRRHLRHRTRRNRRRRRPHRRRQDHAHLPAAALLRRAERRGPHRRRRRERNGSRRPAQPLRRRAAGPVPVHRHDRRQHPPRHRAHSGRSTSPRPPKT